MQIPDTTLHIYYVYTHTRKSNTHTSYNPTNTINIVHTHTHKYSTYNIIYISKSIYMPKRGTRTPDVIQSYVTYVYIKIVDATLYIYMCIHMQKKELHAHLIESKLELNLQFFSDSHE